MFRGSEMDVVAILCKITIPLSMVSFFGYIAERVWLKDLLGFGFFDHWMRPGAAISVFLLSLCIYQMRPRP